MPNFIEIGQSLQRYRNFAIVQVGGCPPYGFVWGKFEYHPRRILRVSIIVQNLVAIGAVVTITRKFQYLAHLA